MYCRTANIRGLLAAFSVVALCATACSGPRSSSEAPSAHDRVDQRAVPLLQEKPEVRYLANNPEAAQIGCCSIQETSETWSCQSVAYADCRALSLMCDGDGCERAWGYAPRATGVECSERCEDSSAFADRVASERARGMELPNGSWARFRLAQELASTGSCHSAEAIFGTLHPSFAELNRTSIDIIRSQCALLDDLDAPQAESIASAAWERDTGSNAMSAAAVMTDSRIYQCDFEGALIWAYRGDSARPTHQTPDVLITAALLYDMQGRPELAGRAAGRYLTTYPHDYYQRPVSDPPEGSSYNRAAAEQIQHERRAAALLLATDETRAMTMGTPDVAMMAAVSQTARDTAPQFDQDFLSSELSPGFSVQKAHELILVLDSAELLALTTQEEDLIREDAYMWLDRGSNGPEECAATSQLLRQRLDLMSDPDQDGILAPDDQCPDEPETFNGVEDEDGCPDEVESLAYIIERQIAITERVLFRLDSAALRPESRAVLDDVAQILRSVPEILLVRVEGHTDRQGTDAYNLDLSRRRAESVRTYLIEQGIAPSRLESEGYGESQPMAFGTTQADHAENRRVEFFIVERDVPR